MEQDEQHDEPQTLNQTIEQLQEHAKQFAIRVLGVDYDQMQREQQQRERRLRWRRRFKIAGYIVLLYAVCTAIAVAAMMPAGSDVRVLVTMLAAVPLFAAWLAWTFFAFLTWVTQM
jgi:hypothetical protein